jgi:hypothetical protein
MQPPMFQDRFDACYPFIAMNGLPFPAMGPNRRSLAGRFAGAPTAVSPCSR